MKNIRIYKSAMQQAEKFLKKEKTVLEAGFLWQKVERTCEEYGLKATATIFVPSNGEEFELTKVQIENIGQEEVCFIPVVAIPSYARSADNIRDHRHMTSFLEDFHDACIAFVNPDMYGRSIMENSSFIASSANPD